MVNCCIYCLSSTSNCSKLGPSYTSLRLVTGMGLPVSISCGVRRVVRLVCIRQLISAGGKASIQFNFVVAQMLFIFTFNVPFTLSTMPCDWGWCTQPNLCFTLRVCSTSLTVFLTKADPLSELIIAGMPNCGITSFVKNVTTVPAPRSLEGTACTHLLNRSLITNRYRLPQTVFSMST